MSAESIDEQAARWAERIRGPRLSDEEYAEFCAWLRSSQGGGEAFAGQQLLAMLTSELRGHRDLKRARWRRLRPGEPSRRAWPWRESAWATAVAVLVVVAGALLLFN